MMMMLMMMNEMSHTRCRFTAPANAQNLERLLLILLRILGLFLLFLLPSDVAVGDARVALWRSKLGLKNATGQL